MSWRRQTRRSLALANANVVLSLLGLVVGVIAACVALAFRFLVELVQAAYLPGGGVENYEDLTRTQLVCAAVLGGLATGLILRAFGSSQVRTGVAQVVVAVQYFGGRLDLRGLLVQFLGAGAALIGGLSVGREGPSVHMGASAASLAAARLGLPNNSIRTLVACGAAAAIAAAFNTPLAGVIFSMEVIALEYSRKTFTPVILAAVSATALSRLIFGESPAFQVPSVAISSLWEIGPVILLGALTGGLAGSLVLACQRIARRTRRWPIVVRTTVVGLVVGVCAMVDPAVMGIGYDTVQDALLSGSTLTALLVILVLKWLATAVCIGGGIPAGIIGPSLVIGAVAGGALGHAIDSVFLQTAPPGFYAFLGAAAMMGAVLQAPLAALTALFELTTNPHIIMPGMVALVSATLAMREGFRVPSIFRMQIQEYGLSYRDDPMSIALHHVSVVAAMRQDVHLTPRHIGPAEAQRLARDGEWLIVEDGAEKTLMPARDLAAYLAGHDETACDLEIDLLKVPAMRRDMAGIGPEATLQEALDQLNNSQADALYVSDPASADSFGVQGWLDEEAIMVAPRRLELGG